MIAYLYFSLSRQSLILKAGGLTKLIKMTLITTQDSFHTLTASFMTQIRTGRLSTTISIA